MKIFVIMRNRKFVRNMTDGKRFTTQYDLVEKHTNKKAAEAAAREYCRMNGAVYYVVQIAGEKE
jgi:hypothetical protein